MKRRTFLSLSSSAAALSLNTPSKAVGSLKPESLAIKHRALRMDVGTQRSPTTPEMLQYFKRHGVNRICGYPPHPGKRGYWTEEELIRTRELCESHGVRLDMVALPFLTSSHIDSENRGAIMLADSPERDRDIEHIHKMIEGCAKAGIPAFKYNMSLLGVLRTPSTPGRGGSRYSTWNLSTAKPSTPLTRAGEIQEEQFWERIDYFVQHIIPICHKHQIRAACHPHDPGVPPEGYQGITRVLGTVDGLKKFISLNDSPYHGLNLCLGTTAEMLLDPAREIHDVIRYFGTRKRIFNIHFRNIRGRRDHFQEVYPDEGDMDMLQVLRTLYEVDYPYMVMPDHMPRHEDDPNGRQAFAFGFGYIKGLLQAVTYVDR